MAGIRLIKRRIRSAKNISKVTYAMEMVAASKMKKAQEQALSGRPYAQKIYGAVSDLAEKTDPKLHPLLKKEEEKDNEKMLLVVISTNKGLCGGLNTNLFRFLIRFKEEKNGQFAYITLGKKGASFILSQKGKILADFSEGKFLENTSAVISLICNLYKEGRYREVWLIYSDFFSALKIKPASFLILPIGIERKTEEKKTVSGEFLIEPSPDEVLKNLLPHFLEVQLRNAILASEASEHSSRMLAMKNATENALDLVSQLTLDYNKERQQNITYEIADMVTAKMSI